MPVRYGETMRIPSPQIAVGARLISTMQAMPIITAARPVDDTQRALKRNLDPDCIRPALLC
jgi:hypothetical protein